MPQPVCRELTRIVQEGLVNVRKHSHARSARVRLSARNGHWTLLIEDDGRGFPFAGRLTQTELDAQGKGPLVIKERVRVIAGELAIESNRDRDRVWKSAFRKAGSGVWTIIKTPANTYRDRRRSSHFRDGLRRLLEAESDLKGHRRSLRRRPKPSKWPAS